MGKKEQIISKICIACSTLLIVGVLFASVLNKSNVNVADVSKDRISDKSVMSEEVKPKVAENNKDTKTETDTKNNEDKDDITKSILDGEVKRVYLDDKLGYSIVIDHGGDFYSIYSNLNKKLNVKKGDRVNKGDVIGSVGKSAAFEIADDYHLHFEIKNGKSYVNPNTL